MTNETIDNYEIKRIENGISFWYEVPGTTIRITMEGKEGECLKLLRKMLKREIPINFSMKD